MKNKMTTAILISLTILLGLFSPMFASEIDWERAKSLRQKMKTGQPLSEEEDAYLKRAMESRTGQARTGTRGDGSDEKATVAPILVSEKDSPLRTLAVTASDGNEIEFIYRVPKANRPLPAIVFIHGGLGQRRPHELIESAKSNPTSTRFLDAGYVAVSATFRTYAETPLSRGPILDSIAIVQAVKKLPEVDPESVIIFGGSGGGSIGLELAGDAAASPLAVIAGEPATVLYTGVMTAVSNRESSMKEYPTLYNNERRKATEQKVAAIFCPILIHHGDIHPLKKINFDVVFPTIQKSGKTIIVKTYPGEGHGFYWGNRTSKETLDLVFSSTLEFIEPLLKSLPASR